MRRGTFSGQTNVIARESALALRRARALTFDLHGDRLAASRFLFAGRHYGDYDLIDVWRCKIIIGSAGEQRYREIGKTRGCPLS